VLGLEPVTSTVTVGPREALDVTEVRADRARELTALDDPLVCEVQLQATGAPVRAPSCATATAGGSRSTPR
jgi:tRNA-specific 2-thiouridylase